MSTSAAKRRSRRAGSRVSASSIGGAAFAALAVSAVSAVLVAGCSSESAPPFPEGQGQLKNDKQGASYPAGPYGVTKGAIIADFVFTGFPAPRETSDPAQAVEIHLSDFYNPSGDDVYPEGSRYGAGEPKPKALLLDTSARWCSPCQEEAAHTLPDLYAQYHPLGVEFFLYLAESNEPSVPAKVSELKLWVNTYHQDFPGGIDPARNLASQFGSSAFPVNILIDTKTMSIVTVLNGKIKDGDPIVQSLDDLIAP